MADDTLTLVFTREAAYQWLRVLTILSTVADIHAPALDYKSDAVKEKLDLLIAFVEGRQP